MVRACEKSGMGQGSIARLLFQFSFPSALGLIANAMYNIIDRLFIGQCAGSDALGAVGLTFPLYVFIAALGSLVGVGSASQMSRFLGERRLSKAERVLGTSTTVMAVFSGVFTIGALLGLDWLVAILGASAHLAHDAKLYTKIILWGMPFTLMGFSLNYLIRAEGHPHYAMWTLVMGAGVNIFLDWLLVAHFSLGVAGAAIGTSVAQVVAFIWTASFYLRGKGHFRAGSVSLSPDWEITREMLLIGASPFCMQIFYTICMTFFNNVIAGLGGDLAIAAIGIFFSLDNLIYIPVFGIGEGLAPIVGYNYGAHQSRRVRKVIKYALIASTGYFIFSFVCAEAFTPYMVRLFTSDDEALVDLTVRAMRIGYIGMPFAAAGIVSSSAFLAIGRSGISLFLNFCRQGLIFLPALIFLPRLMGLDGAWSSFVAVDMGGGIIGIIMLLCYWNVFSGNSKDTAGPVSAPQQVASINALGGD